MAAVASGMTMRLVTKMIYDWFNLATGTSQTIYLCQHIDVSVFQEITFLIRVHNATISNGASTITVNILADGWTLEDPGLSLLNPNDAGGNVLGSVQYGSGLTVPAYSMLTVSKPSGRLLAVNVVGHQGSNSSACNITLSIDVTMKSGDPSALPLDYNTYRGYRI